MKRTLPVLVLLAACAAACGEATPPAASQQAQAPGRKVDPATAGHVGGRVTFAGTPPAPERLRMNVDQACVQNAGPNPVSDAVLVGADGALQNVFIHVLDGLDPGYTFDVPTTPVLLDQKGCVYTPRVVGVMAGQTLEVVNSDPTLHNVHALPMKNVEFNKGQPTQHWKDTAVFTVPEVMVRFKCDVHGWMAAYVGVTPHPYHTVTDASGRFELKGLPPGTYTIEAWHERFGRQTGKVTIATGQTQTLDFTFTNPAS